MHHLKFFPNKKQVLCSTGTGILLWFSEYSSIEYLWVHIKVSLTIIVYTAVILYLPAGIFEHNIPAGRYRSEERRGGKADFVR